MNDSSGAMAVSELGYWMHNEAKSYKMTRYDYVARGATTLFTNEACDGYAGSFEYDLDEPSTTNGEDDLSTEYSHADIISVMHTDEIKSIMVPHGYTVELF